MTWKNMFDGGVCEVAVWEPGYGRPPFGREPAWRGMLAKGGTSPTFQLIDQDCEVSVSAGGVVTLSGPDGSLYPLSATVAVLPQYDVSTNRTRAVAMTVVQFGGASASNDTAFIYQSDQGVVLLDPSGDADDVTPDPVVFDATPSVEGEACLMITDGYSPS